MYVFIKITHTSAVFSYISEVIYRRPVVKIIAESSSQHDEKHVVPTPFSGIRVGGSEVIHNYILLQQVLKTHL
jgi:hypothetical protein